jgi:hypothetical protein
MGNNQSRNARLYRCQLGFILKKQGQTKSAAKALFKRAHLLFCQQSLLLVTVVCIISAFQYQYTYECCSYDYVDHDCTSCPLNLPVRYLRFLSSPILYLQRNISKVKENYKVFKRCLIRLLFFYCSKTVSCANN